MLDMMILDVSGPPHHIHSRDVLDYHTLPELCAFYLDTRQWRRTQRADVMESLARQWRAHALIHGLTKERVNGFNEMLRDAWEEVRMLREPEFPPEQPVAVVPARKAAMFFGKTQLDQMIASGEAETWTREDD